MLSCAGLAAGLARLSVRPAVARPEVGAGVNVDIRQITFGPRHHFFGYIGHVRTIPWNRSGRYIVALAHRVPGPHAQPRRGRRDRAARHGSATTRVEGRRPDTSVESPAGDHALLEPAIARRRSSSSTTAIPRPTRFSPCCSISPRDGGWREYRFPETPFGNSGVAQSGGYFLGINYGRLARLRPVTGYPGAYDWTTGANHPDNDGVFKVDTATKTGQADRLLPATPGRAARHPSTGRDDRLVHQPYAVEPGR